MRYKDIANRLVATPAFTINPNTAFGAVSVTVVALRAYQRACCLCQVLCSCQQKILVLRLAYWWRTCTAPCPPKGSVITAGSRLPIYTFSEIKFFFSSRWFLDIKKKVLLELKGVKIIRSYWDFFQLIRDFIFLYVFIVICKSN